MNVIWLIKVFRSVSRICSVFWKKYNLITNLELPNQEVTNKQSKFDVLTCITACIRYVLSLKRDFVPTGKCVIFSSLTYGSLSV